MGIFLTSIIGAALAASAPSAPFDDSQEHVAVSYGDLDLTTLVGRRSLDRRLYAAAKKICSGNEYPDHGMNQLISRCADSIVGETQTLVATRVAQATARKSSILAAAAIIGK